MIAWLIEAPESDACRQILEGKLWARTYLTIEKATSSRPLRAQPKERNMMFRKMPPILKGLS
jgi:hypothetical protein